MVIIIIIINIVIMMAIILIIKTIIISTRLAIDFIKQCLAWQPEKRLNPLQVE